MSISRVSTIFRLPTKSLDGILCSSVLEYVADPPACLAEFARVLRTGGLPVVSVPNRRSLVRRGQVGVHRLGRRFQRRWFAFSDYSHHEYTSVEFRALLKEYGFTAGASIPFGSPIPRWVQRRELGGSLLAFCATRE